MKARWTIVFLLLSAALLAVQYAACREADGVSYQNRLLAEPVRPGGGELSLKALEELAEEGTVLTYELQRAVGLEALNSSHSGTVTGTNPDYAAVMGYPLLQGGFLTETAYRERMRQAVINETAAFRIFGTVSAAGNTLEMDGELWAVVGVLRDGDEDNANVYVPSTITDGAPEALLVRMDEGRPEAYARSGLKGIGVHDEGYRIANLSDIGAVTRERLSISAMAGAACVLLTLTVTWLRSVRREYRAVREKTASSVAVSRKRELLHMLGLLLLIAAGCLAILLLSRRILEITLGWPRLLEDLEGLSARWFSEKVRGLQKWNRISLLLFAVTMVSHVCFMISLFIERRLWYTIVVTRQSDKLAEADTIPLVH